MKKWTGGLTPVDRNILEAANRRNDLGFHPGYQVVNNGNGTASFAITQSFPGQNIVKAAIERFQR